VILLFGALFTSCALDQGAGHTVSLRMPVFSSSVRSAETRGAIQPDNTDPYLTSSVPPIISWETDVVSTSDTINFELFDMSVECEIELLEDGVVYTGVNDFIDFSFTVYDDDSFEYRMIILHEINDNTVHQKTLIETSIAGDIEGDFITGTGGTVKIWEVNNYYSEETDDVGRLIYLTYDVGLEADQITPSFSIKTNDEVNFSPPFDTINNLGIGAWEGLEIVYFGSQFPQKPLTSAVMEFQLNEGTWNQILSEN
jgi:hypothetical protein